ncbi:MAG: antitoxin VapB family protein [Candidatus Aenigmarchaeota archaeon]|nr:antitoxin VapB family protein [Candidatus Aenigmarchaeota archaeon]
MTKVISLSDEAYGSLKRFKREGESFSEVVMELANERRKRSLLELAGVWKDDPEIEKIFKQVLADRKNFRTRDVKF